MSYIESHQELGDHPKLRRFMRLLKVGRHEAIGILHDLWWWAMTFAKDGNLTRYDAADIADGAHYQGDAQDLLNALVDCRIGEGGYGFVERHADGRLLLHDWDQYGGKLQQAKDREAFLTWLRRCGKRDRCEYPDTEDNFERWKSKLEPVPLSPAPVTSAKSQSPKPANTTSVERPSFVGDVSGRHRTDSLRRGEERRLEETTGDKTRGGLGGTDAAPKEPPVPHEHSRPALSPPDKNMVDSEERDAWAFVEMAYRRNPALREVVGAAERKAREKKRTIGSAWKWRRGVIEMHEKEHPPDLPMGRSGTHLPGAGNTTNQEEIESAQRRHLHGIPTSEWLALEKAARRTLKLAFVSTETLCSQMNREWLRQRNQPGTDYSTQNNRTERISLEIREAMQ